MRPVEAQEVEPAASMLGVEFETLYFLSFEDSVEFFRRVDEIYRELPSRNFFAETDEDFQHDLENWYRALVPAFTMEDLNSGLYPPESVSLKDFGFPGSRSYLGETQCESNEVFVNERFANPLDPLSEEGSLLWTVAHEAAHQAARVCFIYLYSDMPDHQSQEENFRIIESTATMFALEATASLAKEGSAPALYAFLYGLRDAAFTNVVHRAIQQHRTDELEAAVREATSDPILHTVVVDMVAAMEENAITRLNMLNATGGYGGRVVENLVFVASDANFETNRVVLFDEASGTLLPKVVAFDDTLYLLTHIEDFVHQMQEEVVR